MSDLVPLQEVRGTQREIHVMTRLRWEWATKDRQAVLAAPEAGRRGAEGSGVLPQGFQGTPNALGWDICSPEG